MTTTQAPSLERWLLLHQTYSLMYKHLDRCAAQLGHTTAMALSLFVLHQQAEEPLRLSQLARLLGQEAQSVTSLVDRMEQRQLVRRAPDGRDRRVIHVVLTPEGERAVAELQGVFEAALEESLAPLPERERERFSQDLVVLRAHGVALLGWPEEMFGKVAAE